MEEITDNRKAPANSLNRVVLEAEVLTRVDHWIEQLKSERRGIQITRKDLVNWLVCERSECLSEAERERLSERFYDETRFLEQALREMKAAQRMGQKVTLAELMKAQPRVSFQKPRKKNKKTEHVHQQTLESVEMTQSREKSPESGG